MILRNIGTLYACRAEGGQGEVHPIPRAALAWQGDTVTWVGPETQVPEALKNEPALNAGGRLVVPGLVDCHTHLAFGGWRADEFELRIQGRSYLEIAEAGGGIASTMARTRSMGSAELLARCERFLAEIRSLGVTTVECKSGYGLEPDTELRLLEVYRDLATRQPVRIVPTFLGAHIVPPEYRDRRADYVRLLCEELIPAVAAARLARFCDVFVEQGAFTVPEARAILRAGRAAGLVPKLHADQLTAGGGAELAAELDAASADHLECVSASGIRALAKAGTVAVSLPLATLYLGHRPLPARALLDAGVAVAVATDFNPGSAPSYHLPLAMMLACTLQRMTPAEVLKGSTLLAARAIQEEPRIGSLEVGKAADFALIDAESVNHWLYHFRPNACVASFIAGRQVHGAGLAAA